MSHARLSEFPNNPLPLSEDEYPSSEDDEVPGDREQPSAARPDKPPAAAGNGRSASQPPVGVQAPQDQQRAAAVEGIESEAKKFLTNEPNVRHFMRWVQSMDRFQEQAVDDSWTAWGRVADNKDGHLCLRETWLTWMACTSKVLQTVDNKHLNRHLDYQYAGPTVNFVDVQTTPAIGRRLQMLAHFAECINNFCEFPLDCVVPTPETELLFGQGKGNKLVRGMRMKSCPQRVARELELTSTTRAAEKWLKNFSRGSTPTTTMYRVTTCDIVPRITRMLVILISGLLIPYDSIEFSMRCFCDRSSRGWRR
jgi:hypothetical protein